MARPRERAPFQPALTAEQVEAMEADIGQPFSVPALLLILRGTASQDAFAEALGTTRVTYNGWERGRGEISAGYATKLAEVTGLPASRFVRARDREMESLREQVEGMSGALDEIRELLTRLAAQSPALLLNQAVKTLAERPDAHDPEQLQRLVDGLRDVAAETERMAAALETQTRSAGAPSETQAQ